MRSQSQRRRVGPQRKTAGAGRQDHKPFKSCKTKNEVKRSPQPDCEGASMNTRQRKHVSLCEWKSVWHGEERTRAALVFAKRDFSVGLGVCVSFFQSAAPARSLCRFAYRTRKCRVAQEVGARRPFRDWILGCFQCHLETFGTPVPVVQVHVGTCGRDPSH